MTEEPTNAAPERDAPLAGSRLAEARRARKLSLQDVANELHLDLPKVTALEQNRFDELGAPVFVKGYLRKYADIVGLSPDPLLADYRRLEQSEEAPPIVGRRHKPARGEFPAGMLLAALLVLAVAGAGLWVWRSGGLDGLLREPASAPEPAPLAAETPPAVHEEEPADTAGSTPAAAEDGSAAAASPAPVNVPVEETPPEPVLSAPQSVPPPEGQVALQLSFTGECWTEVSDAAGDRLFFGLGRAGETVSVTGAAPLQVLLGNFGNATLTVDGDRYAIPPSARRGDTARLTIDRSTAR